MADFESQLSQSARLGLEDVLNKIANGLRPTSASTLGAFVAGGALGSQVSALGTTGTVSLDPTLGSVFSLTPTAGVTLNAVSVISGQQLSLVISTSGTSSFAINFANNFKTTGALSTASVTGKVFVMEFVSDGTNYNESSRTVAM